MASKRDERKRGLEAIRMRSPELAVEYQSNSMLLSIARRRVLDLQDQLVEQTLGQLAQGTLTPMQSHEAFCRMAGLRLLIEDLTTKTRIAEENLKKEVRHG